MDNLNLHDIYNPKDKFAEQGKINFYKQDKGKNFLL